MRPVRKIFAAAAALGAYPLFVRPRLLRWGATPEELARASPGDTLVPNSRRSSTMAATIDAPPSTVWSWLVQMGFDRAGWYSWDLLDRWGIPSARRIHPEWQSISVGQRLASTPGGKHWFEVAALEPERRLALRAAMSRGTQYDSSLPRPKTFSDALWHFELTPLGGDRTRLLVTTHSASRPRLPSALAGFLFWEPAHFVMQQRQFRNLGRRTAGAPLEGQPGFPPREAIPPESSLAR